LPQHPRLIELCTFLESRRAGVLATVEGHPSERLETAPPAGGWTPAEILQHLAIVESGTTRLLAHRLQRAIDAGLPRETETTSVLTTFTLPPGASEPTRAPDVVLPEPGASSSAALAALADSRLALRTMLHAADGWALAGVSARHPLFGALNMYEWLLVLGEHDTRHARQIRRVLAG
jgi:hypothetical protein